MSSVATRRALTDPNFKMIDRHRKAYAEMLKVGYEFDTDLDESDGCPSQRAFEAASKIEFQAREDLLTTTPQTYEGWMALLYYVDRYSAQQREKGHHDDSVEKVVAKFRDIALRVAA
jgi:hypothetical protein